ncbi:protein phosphatase 1H-like, partial [Psammomys obesus]|uniref:protein phosphatase 1H-like n=1 Tax=Psammomys obesus TaxID=48139 RepID=UPI002452B913
MRPGRKILKGRQTPKAVSREKEEMETVEVLCVDNVQCELCAMNEEVTAAGRGASEAPSPSRAYKTIEDDDLKFPLIYGEGKKARVMATIGVTRGLGDHDLKVHDSNIYIKPFLSSAPEVRVYDLSKYEHGADDVLILATDGLWDVLSNEEVAEAITQFLPNCDPDDPH